jgi:hypothetical protein
LRPRASLEPQGAGLEAEAGPGDFVKAQGEVGGVPGVQQVHHGLAGLSLGGEVGAGDGLEAGTGLALRPGDLADPGQGGRAELDNTGVRTKSEAQGLQGFRVAGQDVRPAEQGCAHRLRSGPVLRLRLARPAHRACSLGSEYRLSRSGPVAEELRKPPFG